MMSKRKPFQDYASKSSDRKGSPIQVPVIDKLMEYLARRNHSEKELMQKLSRKYSKEEVIKAIQEAKDNNWLIDESKLSEQTALMLHRKKKGIIYIQAYLRQKGLPSIKKDNEIEIEKARQILISLDLEDLTNKASKLKARRVLTNRGFDFETIQRVIK